MQSNRSKAQLKKKKNQRNYERKVELVVFYNLQTCFFRDMGLLLAAAAH